jgi:predicted dienelactone hydrolase
VGTTVIALEDRERAEVYESTPGHRSVVLQVWYPAEVASGKRDLYINRPLANALEKWMGIPALLLGDPQPSSSFLGAPIFTDHERFPVVLFNHGYGSFASQNYTQMEALASHGFIAISLSHPYTSLLTQYPDRQEPGARRQRLLEEPARAREEPRRRGNALQGFRGPDPGLRNRHTKASRLAGPDPE